MSLYPGEYDCPVAFLECYCFLPYVFYEVIVILCVLEGLKGDSVVYVYGYCSWDVIIDM